MSHGPPIAASSASFPSSEFRNIWRSEKIADRAVCGEAAAQLLVSSICFGIAGSGSPFAIALQIRSYAFLNSGQLFDAGSVLISYGPTWLYACRTTSCDHVRLFAGA